MCGRLNSHRSWRKTLTSSISGFFYLSSRRWHTFRSYTFAFSCWFAFGRLAKQIFTFYLNYVIASNFVSHMTKTKKHQKKKHTHTISWHSIARPEQIRNSIWSSRETRASATKTKTSSYPETESTSKFIIVFSMRWSAHEGTESKAAAAATATTAHRIMSEKIMGNFSLHECLQH